MAPVLNFRDVLASLQEARESHGTSYGRGVENAEAQDSLEETLQDLHNEKEFIREPQVGRIAIPVFAGSRVCPMLVWAANVHGSRCRSIKICSLQVERKSDSGEGESEMDDEIIDSQEGQNEAGSEEGGDEVEQVFEDLWDRRAETILDNEVAQVRQSCG